jgi:hypothetical protein
MIRIFSTGTGAARVGWKSHEESTTLAFGPEGETKAPSQMYFSDI